MCQSTNVLMNNKIQYNHILQNVLILAAAVTVTLTSTYTMNNRFQSFD